MFPGPALPLRVPAAPMGPVAVVVPPLPSGWSGMRTGGRSCGLAPRALPRGWSPSDKALRDLD